MGSKWQNGILANIADVNMGQSPKGTTCNSIGRGLPLLNGPTEFGSHHPCPVQYTIDPKKHAEIGDLLFCVRGSTTGRMNWADQRYAIGRGIAALRHKSGRLFQPFLKAVVDYNLAELLISATGSTFPNISRPQLLEMPISIPSEKIQLAIAHILGSLDEKIELNRQISEILESIAQVIFKSWFVDFDPVRAKVERRDTCLPDEIASLFPNSFEDSALGKIPKGWKVKQIGQICEVRRGASPRPIHEFMNGKVPWLKIADATSSPGPFIRKTKELLKEEGQSKSVKVKPGDLILSNSATCGVPIFVDLYGCIHDGWLYFSNITEISYGYLYHFLKKIAEELVRIADGSVQKNLNTKLIASQKILVPTQKIVNFFNNYNDPIFKTILENMRQSDELVSLRNILLPKLISGELRIPDVEKFIKEAGL